MDMVLYALLKKEMQDFEYVSGYKIVIVKELPRDENGEIIAEANIIYIVDPNLGDDE